jgi:hypothetical protein
MKRLIVTLAALALSTGLAFAQRGAGCMRNMPAFDPATVQTFAGTIAGIDRQDHGNHVGVLVTLTTASKSITVRIGPEAFLIDNGFQLAAGDAITVKGSLRQTRRYEALIASEVEKDGVTLVLRDSSGKPRWAPSYCNR